MIDHLDAMNRLAEARARRARGEGRKRPVSRLIAAISDADAPEQALAAEAPRQPAGRTPWTSRFRWPRPVVAKPA